MIYWANGGIRAPLIAGPRTKGPHTQVFDAVNYKKPALVFCLNCLAHWPEGGQYPEVCEK